MTLLVLAVLFGAPERVVVVAMAPMACAPLSSCTRTRAAV